ncbi:type 2 DNA topoisomerase 6 subunit B-like [Populus nigra]|uniref:type 2 DNA topoisomerase 6 subunit B-like n=1 Tax=Populus nigra TaxID=3691 RepID=UPI002B26E074|nr:type 2 DNA topoisomerase 6 subunit B-like [Populus nigra]
MEISSTSNLCLHLISCAFQRCRLSQQLCRLSAVLKSPSPSILQISISDTGIGSCLEEFQDLNCSSIISAEFWDGILSVKTTAICDDEIYHYHFNLRENISSSRTLTRLPSNPKNGLKFSGTETCLSISESIDVLVSEINHFFQKMMILNIPNIAIELLIEREDIPGSRCENVFLANRSNPGPLSTSNVEFLKSGLEDYVLKHGNSLTQKCSTCFATSECLKVGSGIACSTESHKSSGLMMEVVIIISEIESTCPCFRECSSKTEVLYFKDFTPCSISHSTLNVLSTIDWKSYGLTLENVVDQGVCVLEWEDSPSHSQIDMVLHCYHKQYPIHKTQLERHLIKKAVKAALNNLKEKHPGILLSAHALKICSHAPDLARSIAGLILSSNDPDFQGECFSLLGLQSREIGSDVVEDCIQEKIVSVIEMNDRKSRQRKVVAPFLFEDDCDQDSNYQDKEYEEGEDEFSYVD